MPVSSPFCWFSRGRSHVSLKGCTSESNPSHKQRQIPCSLGTEVAQCLRHARVEGILRFWTNWHLTWVADEGELKKVVLDAVFDVSWMTHYKIKPDVSSLNIIYIMGN